MTKIIVLLCISVFVFAVSGCTAKDVKPELRPSQKLMQARAAWLTAIGVNLGEKKYDAIAKDAKGLAGEAKKTGDHHPNPFGKEVTLAISSLARDLSAAAGRQDSDTIKAKLTAIKGKCSECHVKIRDKK